MRPLNGAFSTAASRLGSLLECAADSLLANAAGFDDSDRIGGTDVGSCAGTDDSTASRISSGKESDSSPSLGAGVGGAGGFEALLALVLLTDDDLGGAEDLVLSSGLSLFVDFSDGLSLPDRFVWTASPSGFFLSEGFLGADMGGILQEAPTVGKDVNRQITAKAQLAAESGDFRDSTYRSVKIGTGALGPD